MKQRLLAFAAVFIAFVASVSLPAQTPTPAATNEKLYISLENTDNLAVVDLKTFTNSKTLKVGMHPHGQASPATQDKFMSPPKSAAQSHSSTPLKTKSSRRST